MPWGQSGEHTMGDNLRDKYRVALSDTARDGDLGFTSTAELKPSEGLDQVIGQRTPLSLLLKTLRNERPPSNAMTFGDPGIGKTFSIMKVLERVNFYVTQEQDTPGFIERTRTEEKTKREHPFEPTLEELVMDIARSFDNATLMDQVALYNFQKPSHPVAFIASKGNADELEQDLFQLSESLKTGANGILAEIAEVNRLAAAELDFDGYLFRLDLVNAQSGRALIDQKVYKGLPPEDLKEVGKRVRQAEKLLDEMLDTMEESHLSWLAELSHGKQFQDDIAASPVGDSGLVSARPRQGKVPPAPGREDVMKRLRSVYRTYREQVSKLGFKEYSFDIVTAPEGNMSFKLQVPDIQPVEMTTKQFRDGTEDATKLSYRTRRLEQLAQGVVNHNAEQLAQAETSVSQEEGTRVDQLIDQLRDKWSERLGAEPDAKRVLLSWLEDARNDLHAHIVEYLQAEERGMKNKPALDKLLARVLVNHAQTKGVPIEYVQAPTPSNLFGRTEHDAYNNTPEHLRITPGAVMNANGGFLVIDEGIVILSNEAALNYMLTIQQDQTIRVGQVSGADERGGGTSGHIQSEPFLARTKWMMNINENGRGIMERVPQVQRRNRVVDFESEMPDTAENQRKYGQLIANEVARYNGEKAVGSDDLPHFSADAVTYLIQVGRGMAQHKGKLTNNLDAIAKIAIQSAQVARDAGHDRVEAEHVKYHLLQLRSAVEDDQSALVSRDVETGISPPVGERVGKINNAFVIQNPSGIIGAYSREEATIERGAGQPQLVGRGLMGDTTMFGFDLAVTYLAKNFRHVVDSPTMLRAQVSFPTSAVKIDGNSASISGLVALLSALTVDPTKPSREAEKEGVPIIQSIVLTGATGGNAGEVHPIGAVYEKARGVFTELKGWGLYHADESGAVTGKDVERYRELAGQDVREEDITFGFAIPASNLRELQERIALDDELSAAVKAGHFNIYSYSSVDEALEIATGRPAADVLKRCEKMLPLYLGEEVVKRSRWPWKRQ
ncbi:AAA family ATPase [Candidatus Woesearchaeota archaeon]|nr:AAA family ATPase [Candidatus Woesearchaeota archaeon]